MARTHLHRPSQAEDTERMLLGSKSGFVTYLRGRRKTVLLFVPQNKLERLRMSNLLESSFNAGFDVFSPRKWLTAVFVHDISYTFSSFLSLLSNSICLLIEVVSNVRQEELEQQKHYLLISYLFNNGGWNVILIVNFQRLQELHVTQHLL